MAAAYYPPVAFHFNVEILGLTGAGQHDLRFSEVSGLSVELLSEEVPEGGENRFVQKYPTRAKYPELVLKRGLLVGSSAFDWLRASIQDYEIAPKDVDVSLLNEQHEPLLTWHLAKAYPTKWSVSDLNASSNAIAVESLQLFYQRFSVDRG